MSLDFESQKAIRNTVFFCMILKIQLERVLDSYFIGLKRSQSATIEQLSNHQKSFGGMIFGERGIGCVKKVSARQYRGEADESHEGEQTNILTALILNQGKVFDFMVEFMDDRVSSSREHKNVRESEEGSVQEDHEALLATRFVGELLNSFMQSCVILNENRQILLVNDAFKRMFSAELGTAIYGLRPGDLLNCVNAITAPSGCGTSRQCNLCNLVTTVLTCQRQKISVTNEARIQVRRSPREETLNLRVMANPFVFNEHDFVIVTIEDVTNEKNRQLLERIFFHDVINIAGTLTILTDLLKQSRGARQDILDTLVDASHQLFDEIEAQKIISSAENRQLAVRREETALDELVTDIVALVRHYSSVLVSSVTIVTGPMPPTNLMIDNRLLKRVLINMVKNAVEASESGDTVKVWYELDGPQVVLRVQNPAVIDEQIQSQLFQRFFSTKGEGRGIGTYSMKILTEQYLEGTIAFSSTAESGTIFTITLPLHVQKRSGVAR
ncbi:MAG: GHKL domain-containing protein [Chitinivibrionales bacterium]|nr:GHKL domain-containing protein [Chitinivibrionales bacterium]